MKERNARMKVIKGPKLFLYSTKPINPGNEILYCYGIEVPWKKKKPVEKNKVETMAVSTTPKGHDKKTGQTSIIPEDETTADDQKSAETCQVHVKRSLCCSPKSTCNKMRKLDQDQSQAEKAHALAGKLHDAPEEENPSNCEQHIDVSLLPTFVKPPIELVVIKPLLLCNNKEHYCRTSLAHHRNRWHNSLQVPL
ncbi:uncharacterized protein [Amphiura filiformis]|uniref:uncharacterized protein n=1 Tax=Amphiura filiformis TaxID=82378 RepID=UPI003B21F451